MPAPKDPLKIKQWKIKLGKVNKGKKFTKEHRNKISIALKGRQFSEEHKKHLTEAQYGRTPWNKNVHIKLSNGGFKKGNVPWDKGIKRPEISGENSSNWKGGITPVNMAIRGSLEYKSWSLKIMERDNFICQKCGYEKGGILNTHHIKKFSEILENNKIETLEEALACEELWDIKNGITLCKKCHIKIHQQR